MLEISELRKRYRSDPPVDALDGVSLTIEDGGVTALIGPNGAGKTTLGSCVVGIERPDAGSIRLDGADLLGPGAAALRGQIGYAPQEEALFPLLTAGENLRLFGELAGLRGSPLTGEIERVAESFLVGDLLNRRVRQLSGGQRRRVHNAIALLGNPRLVLLDEPTAGVDPATRSAILEVVRSAADQGASVCYATHYLNEVVELDARITFLDQGRVIAEGTVADLLGQHGSDAIELRFDGRTLDEIHLALRAALTVGETVVAGDSIRVIIPEPRSHVATVIASLGEHVGSLTSVEVVSADLDVVYLALTGRRYETPE